MFLTAIGPGGQREDRCFDNQLLSLGALLGKNADGVKACFINNRPADPRQWQYFIPSKHDHVTIHLKVNDFGISFIINTLLSMVLSMIVKALTPKPKAPKFDSKRNEAFGISGFNNTTGPGTPIMTCYGLNRVFGHVIASGATLSADGRNMEGRVLYCLGDAGGDEYGSVSEIQIDGIESTQYPSVQIHIRLGNNSQPVIPEFENVDQLWAVGQVMPFDFMIHIGDPIVYSTHNNSIERATVFLQFPAGLGYFDGSDGNLKNATAAIKVEIKRGSEDPSAYVQLDMSTVGNLNKGDLLLRYMMKTVGEFFKTFTLDFPDADEWNIRLTLMSMKSGTSNNDLGLTGAGSLRVVLYNVQETQFTTETYPGYVLLGVTGIPAKQIKSLESIRISALVEGKRVKIPDGLGGTVLQYTRKRCWIVRDIMTHPVIGMGSEIDESEIDDVQWLESQDYYDELVDGHDGDEPRDLCDVLTNESRWDWDWVKAIAGECRGRIIPSGPQWKYIIDRPGDPKLLYSEPGNIVDGSLMVEMSAPDRPFNQVIGEFRDDFDDYKPNVSEPVSDPDIGVSIIQEALRYDTLTRESEVLRENMIVLKRAALERRRWSFTSPIGAIVSEPLDLDYVAEREIDGEGAYTGILTESGSTGTVFLPLIASLEVGETYAIIVRHQADNTTEYRTVSTAAGNWGAIDVSVPFAQAPSAGDIFALGIENIDQVITRAQELEIDDDGRVKQLRTEYVAAIYNADTLPARRARRNFNLYAAPPLPLRDASVIEQISRTRDGTQQSTLVFDVTPALPSSAGIAQGPGGGSNTIVLAAGEPHIDSQVNYFAGSLITCNGVTRKCTLYVPKSREVVVNSNWGITINPGDQYVITWPRFSEFSGFKVEIADVPPEAILQSQFLDGLTAPDWIPFGERQGIHWETNAGDQRGDYFFRFTPFNSNEFENLNARIVKRVTLTGDTIAPAPPISVNSTGWDKTVDIIVTLQRPVSEDLAGVEINIYHFAVVGFNTVKLIDATSRAGTVQDNASSGTMTIRVSMTLPLAGYGDSYLCEARAIDFSNNASVWVQGNSHTLSAP